MIKALLVPFAVPPCFFRHIKNKAYLVPFALPPYFFPHIKNMAHLAPFAVSIFIFCPIFLELAHHKEMTLNQSHISYDHQLIRRTIIVYQLSTDQDSLEGIQRSGYLGTGNRCLAHHNKEMNLDDMVPLYLLGKLNSCPCWVCYCAHPRY